MSIKIFLFVIKLSSGLWFEIPWRSCNVTATIWWMLIHHRQDRRIMHVFRASCYYGAHWCKSPYPYRPGLLRWNGTTVRYDYHNASKTTMKNMDNKNWEVWYECNHQTQHKYVHISWHMMVRGTIWKCPWRNYMNCHWQGVAVKPIV